MKMYQNKLTDRDLATMNGGYVKTLINKSYMPVISNDCIFFFRINDCSEIAGIPSHPLNFIQELTVDPNNSSDTIQDYEK